MKKTLCVFVFCVGLMGCCHPTRIAYVYSDFKQKDFFSNKSNLESYLPKGRVYTLSPDMKTAFVVGPRRSESLDLDPRTIALLSDGRCVVAPTNYGDAIISTKRGQSKFGYYWCQNTNITISTYAGGAFNEWSGHFNDDYLEIGEILLHYKSQRKGYRYQISPSIRFVAVNVPDAFWLNLKQCFAE